MNSIEFESPEFVTATLSQMRADPRLCDVAIGENKICAHKAMLATASPYFSALFFGNLAITGSHVILLGLSSQGLQKVVDFCYTGRVVLNVHNVEDVMTAAAMLQIKELLDCCSEYLEGQLDVGNCLGILEIAEVTGCTDLRELADDYFKSNFEQVASGEEFLLLSPQTLSALCSDDKVCVHSEVAVYQAILRWVKHDPEKRRYYLTSLLATIRFPQLSPRYLSTTVVSEPLVMGDSFFKEIIRCAIIWGWGSRFWPLKWRQNRIASSAIYFVGGEKWPSSSVQFFDPQTKYFLLTPPLHEPRLSCGLGYLEGQLYVVGGGSSKMEKYDPRDNAWTLTTPMSRDIEKPTVVTTGGFMYVLDSHMVERYHPRDKKWATMSPIPADLRCGRFSAVAAGGNIYVIGANEAEKRNVIFGYDPRADQWTPVQRDRPYMELRGECAVLDNVIYVPTLNFVETFDTTTNLWRTIPDSLPTRGTHFDLLAVDGSLMFVDRYTGTVSTKFLEDCWAYFPLTKNKTRKAAVCVAKVPYR